MERVIASTYEIVQQLGAGGGGIVYLGHHLRLDKPIVLKLDKRTLTAKPEMLRREVDALKNLSHTYIPQVYDFVEQDDGVYTVMDYIEGESLDKPLKRGERFPQAQIVEWACQLLEALCYLHSRPPHGILHSDIKPANIMLTPTGDIRLIDFNIALALGEEGAVRVGFSRGYASPEHYGIDYSQANVTQGVESDVQTALPDPAATQLGDASNSGNGSYGSTSGRRTILLDVRSDIYSLGATLYHLLTGRRPAQKAGDVQPITPQDGVSPAVAEIIRKAMEPNPDMRFQTAAEMLYAFEHLHENDPRTKRHRRLVRTAAAVFTALFLTGGACAFLGLRQMKEAEAQGRIAAEIAEQALAAVTESEQAYQQGDLPGAVAASMEALSLDSPYRPQAQKALTDALGVYDLADGFHSYRTVTLPSEPIKLTLSPGGSRMAVLVLGQVLVFDTDSGAELASLAAEPSALADVLFAGDDTLFYAGEGGVRAYSLSENLELWQGDSATALSLSADGTILAALYKEETSATLYDASSGELLRTVSFGGNHQEGAFNDILADPEDSLFALSNDGRYLAVSFSDGSLTVFDTQDAQRNLTLLDPSAYVHFEGGFYGPYFAFSASRTGESIFAVVDVEEGVQTGGFSSANIFHVLADGGGVRLSSEDTLVLLDPVTGEQTELAYTEGVIASYALDGGHTMTRLENGSLAFFDSGARLLNVLEIGRCDLQDIAGPYAAAASRDTPSVRILRLETHPGAKQFTYDGDYPHDEARIAKDGTVMLFRYDGFRLYSPDGELLLEESIPDANQVYDQQYRREEGYLEVIYYDGTVRRWSAYGGGLLLETAGEKPDKSLYEKYLTSRLRITAPLHERAAAYDRESGELIRELETDSALTYVTEVGEYVITEYITSQDERYGLLLNRDCETLARLPGLCDILEDGTLVFDDMRGHLRQSPIYSLEELTALAGG